MWEVGRIWAAVDDGQICRHVRSWPTELTFPGWRASGRRRVGRDGAPVASAARRPPLDGRASTGRSASRAGVRPAACVGVPDLRALRLRAGLPPGDLGAGRERTSFHGSPEGSVELVSPGEDSRAAIRDVFDAWRRPAARRDPPTRPLAGTSSSGCARVLGPEVEWLPRHPSQRRRRGRRLRALPARSAGSSASHATSCRSTSSTG